MDWEAINLSLELAAITVAILLPIGVLVGRHFAYHQVAGKAIIEAIVALPLVLPPTVFGYYLLVAFGMASPIGQMWQSLFGRQLVFTFEGLVLASVIFNLPFAIQPMQRGFEAIAPDLRAAAACCGMSRWQALLRVELPLAWPGIVTALVLCFAHTLGEFGIVLMVGGAIPGETKTVAIAIYDRVQAFDNVAAGQMAALLGILSLTTIALTLAASRRVARQFG